MVLVCRFRREFQLPIRLVEQVLRVRGMSLHVPFIGLLRSRDLVIGLFRQPLCRGNVRMLIGINIFGRWVLRDCHATGNQTEPKGAC